MRSLPQMRLPAHLEKIIEAITQAGGRPFIVGGAVRDHIMGVAAKDMDIEVFGLTYERLAEVLSVFGRVDFIGQRFGILAVLTPQGRVDISVPRRDNKIGVGHNGFEVSLHPALDEREASLRRDFTINALMFNPVTQELLDFHGGQLDLLARMLRHTSDRFAEDPLRVLRAMQFAGRFDLRLSRQTAILAASLLSEARALNPNDVWREWEKWASQSIKPSRGLEVLVDTTWIKQYPQLANLRITPQDRRWHPEGNVFNHTCFVVDWMALVCSREKITCDERLVLMFAALCHDFGKPSTTLVADDRVVSPNHAQAGKMPTQEFLTTIGAPRWLINAVLPLVEHHMVYTTFAQSKAQVRRLACAVNLRQLSWLAEADSSGRPPLPVGIPPQMRAILLLAAQLEIEDSKPKPLLSGHDLIERGYLPGPQFKQVLHALFEHQLDGAFVDREGAVMFLDEFLKITPLI